jgi:hypothetical protein
MRKMRRRKRGRRKRGKWEPSASRARPMFS